MPQFTPTTTYNADTGLVRYSPPSSLLPAVHISSPDAIRRNYFDLDNSPPPTIAARRLVYMPNISLPPTFIPFDAAPHIERFLRCGRRPPMTITGGTLWSPSSPKSRERDARVGEDYFGSDEEESDDEDDGYRLVTPDEHRARRDAIDIHAAHSLMRESDLEDAREVAAATAGNRSNPKPILKTIKEDSVETPSRRARFAEVVNVQVHIFDDESEDEQSLEDYFGDWSDLDKETILLGKSILEFDPRIAPVPTVPTKRPLSGGIFPSPDSAGPSTPVRPRRPTTSAVALALMATPDFTSYAPITTTRRAHHRLRSGRF